MRSGSPASRSTTYRRRSSRSNRRTSASPCKSKTTDSVKEVPVFRRHVAGIVAVVPLSLSPAVSAPSEEFTRYQAPEFLTFEELRALSANPYPTGHVRQKFEDLWTMTIISNEAYFAGARPHRPFSPPLGDFVRDRKS